MDIGLFVVMPLAFFCEFIDSSLGMGYGTTLTPVLLLMGFEPLTVVPAVLFSEFVSGVTAGFFHHSLRNVNFRPGSKDAKVAGVLSAFGVLGTVAAVLLAVRLPGNVLKLWIGGIVVCMGLAIIVTRNRTFRFAWSKITVLGTIASFNKGLSGGGYGPLVTSGQMLSGVGVKNAVGITSLSEGVTCLIGIIMYCVCKDSVDWSLAPWLMAGAVLSVPFAAHTLKRIPEATAKAVIAVVVLSLGVLTLVKACLGG